MQNFGDISCRDVWLLFTLMVMDDTHYSKHQKMHFKNNNVSLQLSKPGYVFFGLFMALSGDRKHDERRNQNQKFFNILQMGKFVVPAFKRQNITKDKTNMQQRATGWTQTPGS